MWPLDLPRLCRTRFVSRGPGCRRPRPAPHARSLPPQVRVRLNSLFQSDAIYLNVAAGVDKSVVEVSGALIDGAKESLPAAAAGGRSR